jgi:preprotein translocase subunit YajC
MNGWLVLGAIAVLWLFAFSLMYFSLWLEERQREKQLAERLRLVVGEEIIPLDDPRLDRYRSGASR